MLKELQETASFLKITELKAKDAGLRNLRLKKIDVIVAVDGEPFPWELY